MELFDHFPPYGAAFRRRFGLDSEQALELFNQTVSMKSVGNLTEFVRGHMLEAFLSMDVQYLIETAAPVFWPMLVSSLPTGLVVWWVFYLPLKYTVRRYQYRRRRELEGKNRNREPLQ